MRREDIIKQNAPSVPFEEDLVFYAPLTQGDLTDHISGSTGVAVNDTRSDNLTWNSSVGAYIVHARNYKENPIVWSTPNRKEMWNNPIEWTQMYDIRKIDNCVYGLQSGYIDPSIPNNTFDYSNGYTFSHVNSYQSQLSTSTFKTVAISFDYNAQKANVYINGVYVGQNNWVASNLNYTNSDGSFQRVSFASSAGGNFVTHGYARNLLLYNKSLTQAQIQTVINYYHNS